MTDTTTDYCDALIAAVGNDGVIGANGSIPWHIPEDLNIFRSYTEGNVVLMGRKTWDSLPKKPLPKRINVIVTTQTEKLADEVYGIKDLIKVERYEDALGKAYSAESTEEAIINTRKWINKWNPDYRTHKYVKHEFKDLIEIIAIGGSAIYDSLIDKAKKAYITHVDIDSVEDADAFFPKDKLDELWQPVNDAVQLSVPNGQPKSTFQMYERTEKEG